MSEHEPKDQNLLDDLGYEPRDFEVEKAPVPTLWFFISLGVTFAVTLGFMFVVNRDLVGRPDEVELERRRTPEPGVPLLQSNVTADKDIADMNREYERQLANYTWYDREAGVVAAPIEVGMQAVLDEGLPFRDFSEEPGAPSIVMPEPEPEQESVADASVDETTEIAPAPAPQDLREGLPRTLDDPASEGTPETP